MAIKHDLGIRDTRESTQGVGFPQVRESDNGTSGSTVPASIVRVEPDQPVSAGGVDDTEKRRRKRLANQRRELRHLNKAITTHINAGARHLSDLLRARAEAEVIRLRRHIEFDDAVAVRRWIWFVCGAIVGYCLAL